MSIEWVVMIFLGGNRVEMVERMCEILERTLNFASTLEQLEDDV